METPVCSTYALKAGWLRSRSPGIWRFADRLPDIPPATTLDHLPAIARAEPGQALRLLTLVPVS